MYVDVEKICMYGIEEVWSSDTNFRFLEFNNQSFWVLGRQILSFLKDFHLWSRLPKHSWSTVQPWMPKTWREKLRSTWRSSPATRTLSTSFWTRPVALTSLYATRPARQPSLAPWPSRTRRLHRGSCSWSRRRPTSLTPRDGTSCTLPYSRTIWSLSSSCCQSAPTFTQKLRTQTSWARCCWQSQKATKWLSGEHQSYCKKTITCSKYHIKKPPWWLLI